MRRLAPLAAASLLLLIPVAVSVLGADSSAQALDACAEQGPEACYALAHTYVSSEAAARLLASACSGGVPEACHEVAGRQLTGTDLPRDVEAALSSLATACEADLVAACRRLAELRRHGAPIGVPTDLSAAARWAGRACALGDAALCSAGPEEPTGPSACGGEGRPPSGCLGQPELADAPPMAPAPTGTRNVLGGELEPCSTDPMTGWFRDGTCRTDDRDRGVHVVCAQVDEAFLRFTAAKGNDLSTAKPRHGFPGLKPGDRWCLCASRWGEAHAAGAAPPVVLEASHAKALTLVDESALRAGALPAGPGSPGDG